MSTPAAAPLDRSGGKGSRHRAILSLLTARPIRTQHDLVHELNRRRFPVTQATVSRDIRELGLIRIRDRDGGRYVHPEAVGGTGGVGEYAVHLATIFRDHVRSMEFTGPLGVLRTPPSSAPLVAATLDAGNHPEIAGTVAGDDTVLIIVRGTAAATKLYSRLAKLTGNHI